MRLKNFKMLKTSLTVLIGSHGKLKIDIVLGALVWAKICLFIITTMHIVVKKTSLILLKMIQNVPFLPALKSISQLSSFFSVRFKDTVRNNYRQLMKFRFMQNEQRKRCNYSVTKLTNLKVPVPANN